MVWIRYLRCVLRQCASDQRPNDTAKLRNTLTYPNQERTFHKWDRCGDDGKCSVLQACSTHALHSSSNNEHFRRGSNATQEGAEFEETKEA